MVKKKFIKYKGFPDLAKKFIIAIVVFIVFFLIAKIISTFIEKTSNNNKKIENVSKNLAFELFRKFIYFFIILVGIFMASSIMGINISTLLVVLGSAGIGIALALKDFLTQCVAGIAITAFGYYKINDTVQVGDLIGTVKKFDLLYTTIDNYENVTHIIPNNNIIGDEFINYSKNNTVFVDTNICISNQVKGIKYSEIVDKLVNELKTCKYIVDKEARVRVTNMELQGTIINAQMKIEGKNYFEGLNELSLKARDFMSKENILMCDFNFCEWLS